MNNVMRMCGMKIAMKCGEMMTGGMMVTGAMMVTGGMMVTSGMISDMVAMCRRIMEF